MIIFWFIRNPDAITNNFSVQSILFSHLHLGLPSGLFSSCFPTKPLCTVRDNFLYFVCPDLLVGVGETSYGIRVRFIGSTHSTHYLFIYLFVSEQFRKYDML